MVPQLVSDAQLLDRLIEVFRSEGFEGTTLAHLQEATGLKRSSLYHRFPNGKQDMAAAAVIEVARRFKEEVLAPAGEEGQLNKRIDEVGRRLSAFYDNGRLACLLESLSLGTPQPDIAKHVKRAMAAWIEALAGLAQEAGHDRRSANRIAADAVAAIEGALVVSRITGDAAVFHRAIDSLPSRLT